MQLKRMLQTDVDAVHSSTSIKKESTNMEEQQDQKYEPEEEKK